MAKPKGGTLTRLFEVSEQERQAFYDNIHKKNNGLIYSGIPEKGIPVSTTQVSGIPGKGTPEIRKPGCRIRRAIQPQDGHSLGEQMVLTTLWQAAAPVEGAPYRRIAIGYRTLSGMCGLTVNNCKANLRSLQNKLALEAEGRYSPTQATAYRVFSGEEILRRREAAGLTHVARTRGARFVRPEAGILVSGIPETGIPDLSFPVAPEEVRKADFHSLKEPLLGTAPEGKSTAPEGKNTALEGKNTALEGKSTAPQGKKHRT